MEPFVSIVVITYNSSPFILETLESIKAQTYRNIELVISDDNSSDKTIEKCRMWISKNNKRFNKTKLLVSKINAGIPANCNRGINATSGEWIKLIAGDDALIEKCIEKNIQYVNNFSDIKILFSYVKEYNTTFSEANFISLIPKGKPEIMNYEPLVQYQKLLLSGGIHYTPSSFIKKEIFELVGFFDEKYPLLEDYPLWLNITNKGIKLHFMEEETVKYRRHSMAIHNSTNEILIKPSYFNNKRFVEDYIFPNISWDHKLDMKYRFAVSRVLSIPILNKKTKFNIVLHRLFLKYLNPFSYLIKILE